MTIAVMQPYIFPYLGYFHLMEAVDEFVQFDDVQFIARGWINRNQLLVNGAPHVFTIPTKKAPQKTSINKIELSDFEKFREKFRRTLEMSYRHAPYFSETMPIVDEVLEGQPRLVVELVERGLAVLKSRLGLRARIRRSSEFAIDPELAGTERILQICDKLNARTYVNAIGGRELYDSNDFASRGIALQFVDSQFREYPQGSNRPFIPHLSILDVLMFNGIQGTKPLLADFQLKS
jgi:WbqC-like protein family